MMDRDQAERIAKALESIAESLLKVANQPHAAASSLTAHEVSQRVQDYIDKTIPRGLRESGPSDG